MQRIYMHSHHEHLEVFTTVLAPQGRHPCRGNDDKMVVVHSYSPHWPDELELSAGDVIVVLSQDCSGRWFGRLQDGQQGYFPASCVLELGQENLAPKARMRRRSSSQRAASSSGGDGGCVRRNSASGHVLQALRRRSPSGGEAGPDAGRDPSPAPPRRPPPAPQEPGSPHGTPQMQRSPGLLHRILSRCRRRSECQGATNGAFEGD
ncbi:ubiquitin carboxyl-terminal hydrolase 51 [Phycodurus eques]|uniref:ubiquitin carboxyl-terminal hydrolase 51 n=1 Tax=Phycodurus eques TaxID=693459 RepID=UPI002ACE1371|nr:ubiquitin carboxyl-terminal hydrolase 51 [Phycodurus eques]